MSIKEGLEDIPKHIKEWIEGNSTAQTIEAQVISFITGSYGIVLQVLKVVGEPDFKALEGGMLTAAVSEYAAKTGTVLEKLEAAGAAALAAGVALLAGDLAVAFKDVTDAEKANLLHVLSSSKATEAGLAPAAS